MAEELNQDQIEEEENAVDGVSEDSVSSDDKIKFIRQISDVVGYDVEESLMITACRKRLISVDRH